MKISSENYHYFIPEKIGFAVIVILAAFMNSQRFVYDEPYYLENVGFLAKHGFGKDFLLLLKGPAGPTHSIVQYIFSPLTQMKFTLIRLVNPLLFLAITWITNKTFRQLGYKSIGWLGMAVPMTAVCIGMALTEIPAVFFLSASLFFLTKQAIGKINLLWMSLAGLMYSFAIMGRQPMLLMLPFMILINGISLRKLPENILFIVFSLAFPLYCFSVWESLIPVQGALGVKGELILVHFLFALGYGLLTMFLIAPAFLKFPFKINILIPTAGFLGCFGLAIATDQQYPILNTLAQKILPPAIHEYYPHFGFAVVTAAGLYFVAVLLFRLYQHRSDKIFVFSLLAVGSVLFSSLSIQHQFSSRYVFQAYPFMIILAYPYLRTSNFNLITRILGIAIGVASLITYVC
ncbi:hypothetical protein ACX0G7_06835 [Flavitalea antarctica]